jgi:flagellar basal-body rod modification protein FlgD
MFVPVLRSTPNVTSAASTSPAASSTTSSSSTTSTSGLDTMFLQLLSAQLQNQSPLNPLDPNQFVAQLAQFQSLSELTQIDSYMQTLVGDLT